MNDESQCPNSKKLNSLLTYEIKNLKRIFDIAECRIFWLKFKALNKMRGVQASLDSIYELIFCKIQYGLALKAIATIKDAKR